MNDTLHIVCHSLFLTVYSYGNRHFYRVGTFLGVGVLKAIRIGDNLLRAIAKVKCITYNTRTTFSRGFTIEAVLGTANLV